MGGLLHLYDFGILSITLCVMHMEFCERVNRDLVFMHLRE